MEWPVTTWKGEYPLNPTLPGSDNRHNENDISLWKRWKFYLISLSPPFHIQNRGIWSPLLIRNITAFQHSPIKITLDSFRYDELRTCKIKEYSKLWNLVKFSVFFWSFFNFISNVNNLFMILLRYYYDFPPPHHSFPPFNPTSEKNG